MNLHYDGETGSQHLGDGECALWETHTTDLPAWGTEPEPPQQFDTREEQMLDQIGDD